MVVTKPCVAKMVEEGSLLGPAWAMHSVTVLRDRLFTNIEYFGTRWTWELFDAHWSDGRGPDIYIGRWPD